MTDTTHENPLLGLGFDIPFDRIDASHVEPAIDTLIARAQEALEEIGRRDTPRTYARTLDAFEQATEGLERAMTVVGHLEAVATSDAFRAAYNAARPKASAFFAAIPHDGPLYRALSEFAETDEAKALSPLAKRFLDKTLREFRREGAELPEAEKARLREVDVELSRITNTFSQNVLDETSAFELYVEDEARLAGLPKRAKEAARASAEAKGEEGYRFSLQAPSLIPALTYLEDASIRETLWRAYNTRATKAPRDNAPLIAEIIALRAEKARLLGYRDFADFVLEERMAKRGETAAGFVRDLEAKARAAFEAETEGLTAFRRELEGDDAPPLAPWDVGYYSEKLRKARFELDEEALRPYFPAPKVVDGLFRVAEKLYGIRFVPAPGVPGWHEDVAAYEIYEGERHLARFYVDLHPRETKRGGAWMNPLQTGGPRPDGSFAPHLGLFCANITPPSADGPALLTHAEVETLFHEFGHLLHHSLSEVPIRSLAGTHVAWDFVELPSQIMENWTWEREALDLFARHYETDAPLPEALLSKMRAARTFRAASAMMRQLGFASVDLALHVDYDPTNDGDPIAFARAKLAPFQPAPVPDDYAMIAGFTHLFASPVGYAAGYYSYKWAEVLDADAFARFSDEGLFDREVGRAFREEILAKGDSQDPDVLFRAFRGREPSVDALLTRSGLAAGA